MLNQNSTMHAHEYTTNQDVTGDNPLSLPHIKNVMQLKTEVDDDKFVKEFLRCHNEYRAKHNVPPLQVSAKLNKFSQNWANSLAVRNVMENSNSGLGENIFFKSGFEMYPQESVNIWYKEGLNYPYSSNEFNLSTGHFTQLMWRDSEELGVGIARNPTTGTYVVAHYYPPGNIQGKFALNVLPPSK